MKRIMSFLLVAILVFGFSAMAEPAPEAASALGVRSGTDYANADNWAYFGIGEDRAADVFLICPTVDLNDEFNMSLEDADTKAKFLGALNMERGIYEDTARLYAPYYRQVAMKVYTLEPSEREPWLALAYEDVSAAFAWYLAHENAGRPIVLAGFSQGADMCFRLLEEYFGDEALYRQLIAVYAIGWPCTEEKIAQYPQIRAATGEDDLGVVVSFDCEAPEVTQTLIVPAGVRALTINPLNWRTDGTPADKSENLGACFTQYSGEIKREEAGLCGCYIDESRGVVKVTDVDPADYPPIVPVLPEGAYHYYDYQFFFRNLQKNVADRTARFLQTGAADEAAEETPFTQWNPDAPALNALIEYVEAVTDPDSPDFIPEEDRIATFDLDGTLMGELAPTYTENVLLMHRVFDDPTYQPDADMVEFCRVLRDHALDKSFPESFEYEFSSHLAKAFAGMTPDEYIDYVTRFLVTEADGFDGMTYADACYLPMAEVVDYLRDNGFKCYIVSGSDRFTIRAFVEGVIDIPWENCIGTDSQLKARDQGDVKDFEYLFTGDDSLVRTGELLVKDIKTSKVLQIAREIGRQPVLSFGNSSGDTGMHNYVLLNNRYRSAAFQLVADDDVRDYGNPEKGAELREKWESMGYHPISMRDDWKTIYGTDVKKTGEFHWLTDYADDRIPAVPETAAEEEAETETNPDVQYILYLGTNDKDTNKPVFTQAEALEKAKDILIRHFGGYTIQEAHGGWIDGETEYQEYTLVIYLSDTTMDEVHAAADEMIEVFHQSSVLIQENPTRTEFYSSANP